MPISPIHPHQSPDPDADDLATLLKTSGLWALAPRWVPRTGYTTPTPDLLTAIETGLHRLREQSANEPVPHPGCHICHTAGNSRAAAHVRNDPVPAQNFSDIIERHPHPTPDTAPDQETAR